MTFKSLSKLAVSWFLIQFAFLLLNAQSSGEEGKISQFQIQQRQEEIRLELTDLRKEIEVYKNLESDLEQLKSDVAAIKYDESLSGKKDDFLKKMNALSGKSHSEQEFEEIGQAYRDIVFGNWSAFNEITFGIIRKLEGQPSDFEGRTIKNVYSDLYSTLEKKRDAQLNREVTEVAFIQLDEEGGDWKFDPEKSLKGIIENREKIRKNIGDFHTQENFTKCKEIFTSSIDGSLSAVSSELETRKEEKNRLDAEAEKLFNDGQAKAEGQFKIDKILVWTLPLYGLLMVLMLLIPKFYSGMSIRQAIFDSGLILQLITVYLLTVTIMILGISEKINSEVLGTLIGGISGYVLGKNMKNGGGVGNLLGRSQAPEPAPAAPALVEDKKEKNPQTPNEDSAE